MCDFQFRIPEEAVTAFAGLELLAAQRKQGSLRDCYQLVAERLLQRHGGSLGGIPSEESQKLPDRWR